MYRPFFGNRAVYPDEMLANVVDRALQLDMDRLAQDRREGFRKVTPLLVDANEGVSVAFLDDASLAEFRLRVSEATERPFTWERLVAMARRQYPQQNSVAQDMAQRFLEDMPNTLEQAYQRVPRQAIQSFRDAIVHEWSKRMRVYLS